MRIAHVVAYEETVPPRSQNGLEFVVSSLTEELVARGHEVTLFAPEGSKTAGKLVSIIPQELMGIGENAWLQPMRSMWNATLAASMADQFDIIHCHTSSIAYSLPFIKTPVIFTLHHRFEDDIWKPEFKDAAYRARMQFIFDQYSRIFYVPISKRQESGFLEAKDAYFKNYRRIPNGIPVESFEWNGTPGDYLLYIGYINRNKGADVAVQVARELDMKLVLAGNTFGEEEFFETSIKPYLSDKITYVGTVDFKGKNDLYKNALATLAPLYWHEPFGLTLVESQACGTPVVAFDKGAASELIDEGVTGFVVENKEAMIEAVQKIGSIDRTAPRAWVEKHFTVARMTDQYEKLYKDLA